MYDVMIDIETLGRSSDATILSIGAVRFNPLTGAIAEDKFFRTIDIRQDRKIEADTLMWWLGQDQAIFRSMCKGNYSLENALLNLIDFIEVPGYKTTVWALGVMFDIAILEHAYQQHGMGVPWEFGQISCMRTLKNMVDPKFPKDNTQKHNALADALWQAKWVCAAIKHLKGK